jgi:hypothetical protein
MRKNKRKSKIFNLIFAELRRKVNGRFIKFYYFICLCKVDWSFHAGYVTRWEGAQCSGASLRL